MKIAMVGAGARVSTRDPATGPAPGLSHDGKGGSYRPLLDLLFQLSRRWPGTVTRIGTRRSTMYFVLSVVPHSQFSPITFG